MNREREAQHPGRFRRRRGPAGDACARRPPASDERQPGQGATPQLCDDGYPRGIELRRRRGRAPPGDAVRLLDERHREPGRPGRARRGNEIRRVDAAARTVTEDEPAAGTFGRPQMGVCRAVRCCDFENVGQGSHSLTQPELSSKHRDETFRTLAPPVRLAARRSRADHGDRTRGRTRARAGIDRRHDHDQRRTGAARRHARLPPEPRRPDEDRRADGPFHPCRGRAALGEDRLGARGARAARVLEHRAMAGRQLTCPADTQRAARSSITGRSCTSGRTRCCSTSCCTRGPKVILPSYEFSGQVTRHGTGWRVNRLYTIATFSHPSAKPTQVVGPNDFAAPSSSPSPATNNARLSTGTRLPCSSSSAASSSSRSASASLPSSAAAGFAAPPRVRRIRPRGVVPQRRAARRALARGARARRSRRLPDHLPPRHARLRDDLRPLGTRRAFASSPTTAPGTAARRAGRAAPSPTSSPTSPRVADALGLERFATWGLSGGGPHSLACAALCDERLVAAATLAGVGPWNAEGLDWLAGMGEGNLKEFDLVLAGEEALRPALERERTRPARRDGRAAARRDGAAPEPDRQRGAHGRPRRVLPLEHGARARRRRRRLDRRQPRVRQAVGFELVGDRPAGPRRPGRRRPDGSARSTASGWRRTCRAASRGSTTRTATSRSPSTWCRRCTPGCSRTAEHRVQRDGCGRRSSRPPTARACSRSSGATACGSARRASSPARRSTSASPCSAG